MNPMQEHLEAIADLFGVDDAVSLAAILAGEAARLLHHAGAGGLNASVHTTDNVSIPFTIELHPKPDPRLDPSLT